MKKLSLVALWLVSLVAATGLAWGVVNVAGSRVTDHPVIPVVAASSTQETVGDTRASGSTSPSTSAAPTTNQTPTGTAATSTTRTTSPGSTSTTTLGTTSSTSTTVPGSSTTVPPTTQTVVLIGGTVTYTVGGGTVTFEAAIPAPGFTVSVENQTPNELHVRFESNDHRSDLKVEIESGIAIVDVDEEDT